MRIIFFPLFLCINFAIALPAHAERYALVIGNSQYQIGALKNPVNDADDMTALLRRKGFQVKKLTDANKKQMKEAIRSFTNRLYQENSVGLFYYAGHGIEIDGSNYLIPVDANIQNETDVEYEAVDAGRVLAGMRRAGNNLNMVILDACRDNPYARSFRTSSRGLAKMNAPEGSLVLYATSPGDVAADGLGRNGLFTQHLMDSIQTPNLTVEKVFKQTAIKVHKATNGDQLPWQSGVILGDFYFTINAPKAKTVTVDSSVGGRHQAELLYWESIQNETDPVFFDSYLKKYPQGTYAELAKLKIENYNAAASASAPASPPPEKAFLTIKTSPDDARVRILNIGPKYREGLELPPGRYHIEVSKPGYRRHTEWLSLEAENKVHSVVLTEAEVARPNPPAGTSGGAGYQPAMVDIRGGCFQMGSPDWETGRDDDERSHRVCVDGFQLGEKEVTVGEFRRFISATGYRTEAERNVKESGCFAYSSSENKWDWQSGRNWKNPGLSQNDQHPVVCVSWNDVQRYLDWLNGNTSGGYRLPTEAEWEYAARAGSQTAYFWSSEVDEKACRYGNVNDKNWGINFLVMTEIVSLPQSAVTAPINLAYMISAAMSGNGPVQSTARNIAAARNAV